MQRTRVAPAARRAGRRAGAGALHAGAWRHVAGAERCGSANGHQRGLAAAPAGEHAARRGAGRPVSFAIVY